MDRPSADHAGFVVEEGARTDKAGSVALLPPPRSNFSPCQTAAGLCNPAAQGCAGRAAFPVPWSQDFKFWPAVARVESAYGDRNLICSCPPADSYAEAEAQTS